MCPVNAERLRNFPSIIHICIGWIILGAFPIISFCQPVPPLFFFNSHPTAQLAGKALLVLLLVAAGFFIWRRDGEKGRAKLVRYAGFALLAGLLTDLHYDRVDNSSIVWQLEQFLGILKHTYAAPDQYRFLSQGTLWWMTLTNGDFVFSYVLFRFFFTFLLCLAIYRLARCYLAPQPAVMIVFLYGAFYPMSTRLYFGNLLDPMSHLVMFSALYYARQKRFWEFFWLFVLGVFVKETMLLLAPCYWLMNLEGTRLWEKQNLQRLVLLGVTGMMVFFACRLPFNFNYDFQTLNRTPESMIYANLGIGSAMAASTVPLVWRYVHPLVFLFMWWPLLIWQRRRLPPSLLWTSLYLAIALFATNTMFGWNHESRNFVPGLVLLLIGTMMILIDWMSEEKADLNPGMK
jgi:hypothetical protein